MEAFKEYIISIASNKPTVSLMGVLAITVILSFVLSCVTSRKEIDESLKNEINQGGI